MRSFLPSCLCPLQQGQMQKSLHMVMPTMSIPRTCPLSFSQPSTMSSMCKHLPDEQEVWFNSPSCVDNADNVLKLISQLRCFHRIPIRILKSCRIPIADVIYRTLTSVLNIDWNSLVFLLILTLGVLISTNTAGSSLSLLSSVTTLTISLLSRHPLPTVACLQTRRETSSSKKLRSNIITKLMLNDI